MPRLFDIYKREQELFLVRHVAGEKHLFLTLIKPNGEVADGCKYEVKEEGVLGEGYLTCIFWEEFNSEFKLVRHSYYQEYLYKLKVLRDKLLLFIRTL